MTSPKYNIDDLFGRAREAQDLGDLAYELWGVLEKDESGALRPDTHLLAPEIHFRDMMHFHCSCMGNGFGNTLYESNGLIPFARALAASKAMNISEIQEILELAERLFLDHGIAVPREYSPEWWTGDWPVIEDSVHETVSKLARPLDERYWALSANPIYHKMLAYMNTEREQLIVRKDA